jgi:hypothetical protein
LVLQPTVTAKQKTYGTRLHFALNTVAIAAFISAFVVIELNKEAGHHLKSPHSILGLITYILVLLQAVFGVIQYFFPVTILGSEEKGKQLYWYHRLSGYTVLVLQLATVAAATQTTYNQDVLHVHLWSVLVTAVLVIQTGDRLGI